MGRERAAGDYITALPKLFRADRLVKQLACVEKLFEPLGVAHAVVRDNRECAQDREVGTVILASQPWTVLGFSRTINAHSSSHSMHTMINNGLGLRYSWPLLCEPTHRALLHARLWRGADGQCSPQVVQYTAVCACTIYSSITSPPEMSPLVHDDSKWGPPRHAFPSLRFA